MVIEKGTGSCCRHNVYLFEGKWWHQVQDKFLTKQCQHGMILRCPCTWAEPPNREEYSMSEQVDNIEADKAYPGKFDESRYRGFIIKNKKDHAFFYCKYSIKGYEHLGAWRKIIWVKDYIDCRDAKLKKFKASKERKQVVTEVAQ